MAINWKPNEFKIGINMAGAVSAGAYTAGVLDFLMEALEEWQKAKDAFRAHLAKPSASDSFENPVPLHDICIEVFSGASAGGMCAAIASVVVQEDFQHITDPNATDTNNRFYEAWVNQIDISKLLGAQDLKNDARLISILDSTIIDTIAEYALTPGASSGRPFISKSLTLFLTLTNVRGVPYQLYNDPSPGSNEFTTYYGDRLCFETTGPSADASTLLAKPLPAGQPRQGAWALLRTAAKATGAFPLFLAPQELTRDLADYKVPNWIPISAADPGIPSDLPKPPGEIPTLNVDGGVTDNNPFDLAHDFLAGQNPKAKDGLNPRSALEANCAVISVAPFPSKDRYDPNYDFRKAENIFTMMGRLVTVLVSQSRFLGESLAVLTSGAAFSRFVIAPSDPSQKSQNALQCGSLGAFGGFMERSFRAHDFLLGRRNCQWFLKTHFRLPLENPVIASGQDEAGSYAQAIASKFASDPPPHPRDVKPDPAGRVWMPVIPLVGSASAEAPNPKRGTISSERIKIIANMMLARLDAIKDPLLVGVPMAGPLEILIGVLCKWPARILVRGKIVEALTEALPPDAKE